MRRIIPIIMTLSAFALLLASCGKEPMPWNRKSQAIRLTVSGVTDTKASVITTTSIRTGGFNISGYVTASWRKDSVGQSLPVHDPGLYIDPSANNALNDVLVTYDSGRDDPWRISGNEDYDNPAFSWVNGKAMNFFAYAPVSVSGRTITKSASSIDADYPFKYTAPATSDIVVPSDCHDLIFAYAQHTATFESDETKPGYGELESGSSDKFDLTFHHALAQIRFCLSTDDGTFDPSSELVSVRLQGVNRYGECTFKGSDNSFAWKNQGTPASYRQTFNATFSGSSAPSGWTKGSYSSGAYNLYTNTGDYLFVIPQSLSECKVEIVLKQDGVTTTLEAKLPATKSSSTAVSWDAGMYYTYKIKAAKTLTLELLANDWVDGGSDITI